MIITLKFQKGWFRKAVQQGWLDVLNTWYIQADRQTDRQTDRLTDRQRGRQKKDRNTDSEWKAGSYPERLTQRYI